MSIESLRNEIDAVDSQMVSLFEKRMKIAGRIAEYKKENSLPVFDKSREEEVLKKLADLSDEEMKDYVVSLYEKIFELSRSYQEKLNEKTED